MRIDSLAEPGQEGFFEQLTQLPFSLDLKAGNIIDDFKNIRELNATSRSQVYLAGDLQVKNTTDKNRQVVIKTPSVNFDDDPSYIDLFLHEEWVAKRLLSPPI